MDGHGRGRLMVPRVVTGCKCWHMRDSETFYPKVNFELAVGSLPKGAEVRGHCVAVLS